MRGFSRSFRWAQFALVFAVGLAGCGGDDNTVVAPTPDVYSGQIAASRTADIYVADSTVVTMTVTNQNGQPAAGQAVTFSVTSGVATLSGGPSWTTDANGRASTVVRASEAGSVTVAGALGSSAAGQVTLTFIPDVLSGTLAISNEGDLRMSVQPLVTFTVANQNGDPQTGVPVSFRLTGDAGVVTGVDWPDGAETNSNGQAEFLLTALVPGSIGLEAFIGDTPDGDAEDVLDVTFVVGAPAGLAFAAMPKLTVPRIALPIVPTVQVVDDEGFAVAAEGVDVEFGFAGQAGGITQATNEQGRVSLDGVGLANPGTFVYRATADGLGTVESEPVTSMYLDSFDFHAGAVCMPEVSGSVYCWGSNATGLVDPLQPGEPIGTPTRVEDPGVRYQSVSLGNEIACGRDDTRGVRCWGIGSRHGSPDAAGLDITPPLPILEGATFSWQRVGFGNGCARVKGGLFNTATVCWGANPRGMLGTGASYGVTNRVEFGALVNPPLNDISMGNTNACGLSDDHELYCWGNGTSGVVVDGSASEDDQLLPVLIPSEHEWRAVDVGNHSACAITFDNELYCWGSDTQLTWGVEPTRVDFPAPVVAVRVAQNSACAATADGNLYCWGNRIARNYEGVANLPGARRVLDAPADISNFAVGLYHACLTDSEGQAYCFGRDGFGQLGQGEVGEFGTLTPVRPVTGGHTFMTEPLR